MAGTQPLATVEAVPGAPPPVLGRTVAADLEAPLLGGGGSTPAAAAAAAHATPGREACKLLGLGWPLVLEELLSYGSSVLALAMVGRLGGDALGVFALCECRRTPSLLRSSAACPR